MLDNDLGQQIVNSIEKHLMSKIVKQKLSQRLQYLVKILQKYKAYLCNYQRNTKSLIINKITS